MAEINGNNLDRMSGINARRQLHSPAAIREFELVSLVDVVFLLLIFSMSVALETKPTPIPEEGRASVIVKLDRGEYEYDVEHQRMIIEWKHGEKAGNDTTLYFPPDENFMDRDPVSLMLEVPWSEVIRIIEELREEDDRATLQVRASHDTPFKIVNFIIWECSQQDIDFLEMKPLEND
jgi:hypothetical protein